MGETSSYEPSSYWSGHDFQEEKKKYDANAGRSYAKAAAAGVTIKDLLPRSLSTKSRYPFAAWVDGTGSMGGWPAVMAGKLPYLEHQLRTEYLGEEMEVSWGEICDSTDRYPFQVRHFAKGAETKTELDKLIWASGGGGDGDSDGPAERYDGALLYLARNITMPKEAKPIAVFVGDEMPYNTLPRTIAAQFCVSMEEPEMSIRKIIKEVQKRWDFYFIMAKTGNYGSRNESETQAKWESLIGEDHVAVLDQPDRVVDVIFGILGAARGRVDYFQEEIERRQRPDQVEAVYTALTNVLKGKRLQSLPRTVLPQLGSGSGKKSQPLLTKK